MKKCVRLVSRLVRLLGTSFLLLFLNGFHGWVHAENHPLIKLSVRVEPAKFASSLPIESDLRSVLEAGGFTVVDTKRKEKEFDLEVAIDIILTPLGGNYSYIVGDPGPFYYTGAKVSGTILGSTQLKKVEKRFFGKITPPHRITYSGSATESGAPFIEAFKSSQFWEIIGEVFEEAMGQGAAVDFWVGVLRQGFPHLAYLKYEGGAKLKDIGHPAVRKLIALFEGNDRTVAIDVISAIGEPAVPDLLTALSDEHLQTQMGAMEALARIKDIRAIDPLFELLTGPNRDLREEAVFALSRIGRPAKEALKNAATSEDANVRKIAIKGLGEIQEPDVIPVFLHGLNDSSSSVRYRALNGLKKYERFGADGEMYVFQELTTVRYDQLQNVVTALQEIGNPVAVNPLITTLATLQEKKAPLKYQDNICQALKDLTHADFGLDVQAWREWWEKENLHQE